MTPRHMMLFCLSILTVLLGNISAEATELALKRVMLSSGGVGYFEYEARVSGDAELALEIRRDRVDDVLKSIVVYDDLGGVGTISLPGREPLQDVFRELPFGRDALESPVALLNALRGQVVRIAGNPEITGRLVAVTEDQEPVPGNGSAVPLARHRLSLLTTEGLRQAVLEDLGTIQLGDERLRGQLDTALRALSEHSERDRRRLTLRTRGPAGTERAVRVAYVVAAPLWKTAYRLTMQPEGRGLLQGWAVLENLSGEDWNGVELTLTSGHPVTFRQALYDAYYVNRPLVPVDVLGRILPKADEGTVTGSGPAAAPPPPPPAPAPRAMARGLGLGEMMAAPKAAAEPQPVRLAELATADASEGAALVLFRHPHPVNVTNGHSLLLPIISRAVPAERLALYQPATQPRHPLAAVRLTNDGTTGLPPGILTLYDGSAEGGNAHVGDARLSALPAGEERLLAYAVDQKLTIDRSETPSQTLARGRLADGMLHLSVSERLTTRYILTGAAREARTLVIEHQRRPGWELTAPADAAPALTADAYRLRQELAPGQTLTLNVTLERPRQERLELTGLAAEQLGAYAVAPELTQEQRDALSRLDSLRAVQAEQERRLERLEQERAGLARDQERLRDNLRAVTAGTDLHRRYLARLGDTEDRLERLEPELAASRTALDEAREAVAVYARGLKL